MEKGYQVKRKEKVNLSNYGKRCLFFWYRHIKSCGSCLVLMVILVFSCKDNMRVKAETCLNIGDFKRAARYYRELIDRNPDSFKYRYGLGRALLQRCSDLVINGNVRSTDWQEAARQIDYALKIKDDSTAAHDIAYAWYKAAKSACTEGDSAAAQEYASRSTLYAPEDSDYLNFQGILLSKRGFADSALQVFSSAIEADSTDPTAWFNTGMIHWNDDKPFTAHRWWLQALKRAPTNDIIIYWFAKADNVINTKKKNHESIEK